MPIFLFLAAVSKHWIEFAIGALAIGGMTAFSITVIERYLDRTVPWWAYIGIFGIGGLVTASYYAWLDQRNESVAEQGSIMTLTTQINSMKKDNKPDLHLNPEMIMVREVANVGDKTAWGLFAEIEVTNGGASSICEYWQAYLHARGQSFLLKREGIPEDFPLVRISKDRAVLYHRDQDSLTRNTTNAPIQHSGRAAGWIAFEFPDLPQHLLPINVRGNELIFSCRAPDDEHFWLTVDASEIKIVDVRKFISEDEPTLSGPEKYHAGRITRSKARQRLIN